MSNNIDGIEPELSNHAVSLYNQNDGSEEFPILKAFQQYIDSEQAKARKRMLMLSVFFGFMMIVVIAVFVALLVNVSSRNQLLNDRLIEYAMRNQAQPGSAVVVQPPQDSAAILAITGKLEEMQKKISEAQTKAAQDVAAAQMPKKEDTRTNEAEMREIQRLKALLAAEKKNVEVEKEKARQAELEAYRRKHYPELYRDSEEEATSRAVRKTSVKPKRVLDEDEEIDAIIRDVEAIRYFDEDDEDRPVASPRKYKAPPSSSKPEKENYSIPVDIKGSSSSWNIPLE